VANFILRVFKKKIFNNYIIKENKKNLFKKSFYILNIYNLYLLKRTKFILRNYNL
jgi:hypothetical protein